MEWDLSRLDQRTREAVGGHFNDQFHKDLAHAIERQTQIAAQRRDTVQWSNDFVPKEEIDPVVDTLWRKFYGHSYTEDEDLMKFLRRRNPEIEMRPKSNKIQVGYTAAQAARKGCRFMAGTMQFAK